MFSLSATKMWGCQSVKAIWISGSPFVKNDPEMTHSNSSFTTCRLWLFKESVQPSKGLTLLAISCRVCRRILICCCALPFQIFISLWWGFLKLARDYFCSATSSFFWLQEFYLLFMQFQYSFLSFLQSSSRLLNLARGWEGFQREISELDTWTPRMAFPSRTCHETT